MPHWIHALSLSISSFVKYFDPYSIISSMNFGSVFLTIFCSSTMVGYLLLVIINLNWWLFFVGALV